MGREAHTQEIEAVKRYHMFSSLYLVFGREASEGIGCVSAKPTHYTAGQRRCQGKTQFIYNSAARVGGGQAGSAALMENQNKKHAKTPSFFVDCFEKMVYIDIGHTKRNRSI